MISIIVPAYNQHEATAECLTAVLETTEGCEIIVVDNGSDPPIKPPFSGFTEIRVIRNEENKGFPAAVNQGIRDAKGTIIVLLNNDVIVTPGWSDRLVSALDEYSIVGPVTNYVAGMQRMQVTSYHNKDELNEAAGELAEEYDGHVEDVNFIIGFLMVFKKSLFDEIGDFDESLWPCSGEEVDFCFRAKAAGHNIGIVHDVYVHHEGSQTFNEMEKNGQLNYQEVCKKTDEHLFKKYGDFWKKQAASNAPTIEIDPGATLKLNLGSGYAPQPGYINIDNRAEVNPDLVCDVIEGLPYPDNSVDEVRAYDFLEHVSIGLTVRVVTEIWRVLKPGGRFESLTPSTDGRGAFQDPTHVSFWNKNSWLYYSEPVYRDLYGIKADFKIEAIMDLEIVKGLNVIHTHVIARAQK